MAIRVLLVDVEPDFHASLRPVLEANGEFCIVGEAEDGTSAIQLASTLNPDVALLEIGSQRVEGIDATMALKQHSPHTGLLLTSGAFDYRTVLCGLTGGARGFILKSESLPQFAAFIKKLSAGGYCCSESLRDLLIPTPQGFQFVRPRALRLESLSGREREMLIQVADGKSLKQAARALNISYKSADRLKQSLMHKLEIHDRLKLAQLVFEEGLST